MDKHHIAKVDDHSSVMIMKVNDFEAMGAMMSSDEMKAWDAENGCVDVIYNMEEVTELLTLLEKIEHSEVQRVGDKNGVRNYFTLGCAGSYRPNDGRG